MPADHDILNRLAALERRIKNGLTLAALTVTGTLTTLGNIVMATGKWIGLGSSAGRFVFTDAATDTIAVTSATFQITTGSVISNTYTPTLTNTTNIDASTAEACQYMQVGDVVTVGGRVSIDTTAAAATVMGMSLPIASNFGNIREAAGTAAAAGFAYLIEIRGDAANDRVNFAFTATGTANVSYYFTFTYKVI